MKSLYDFPKDMLVKLVTTIREDTIKECKEKHEKEIKKIVYKVSNKEFIECIATDCKNFMYLVYDEIIHSNGMVESLCCVFCFYSYCIEHKNNYVIINTDDYTVCKGCLPTMYQNYEKEYVDGLLERNL